MVRGLRKLAIRIHTVAVIARGIHRTEVAVVVKTTWSGQAATGTFIALRPIRRAPGVRDCSTASRNRLKWVLKVRKLVEYEWSSEC